MLAFAVEQQNRRFDALFGSELDLWIHEAIGGADLAVDLQFLVDQPVVEAGPKIL